jgi:hypothetical protein
MIYINRKNHQNEVHRQVSTFQIFIGSLIHDQELVNMSKNEKKDHACYAN